MEVPFLVDVLQRLHTLTIYYNPLMKHWLQNQPRVGYRECMYKEYKYVTSTLVHRYILSKRLSSQEEGSNDDGNHHGSTTTTSFDLTQDDFYSLTNEEHMPFISPDIAQFLLDVEVAITPNEIEQSDVKETQISSLCKGEEEDSREREIFIPITMTKKKS